MMRWVDAEQDAAGGVRRWDRAARAVVDYDPAGVEVARGARAQEVIDSPSASAEDRKSARATLRLAGAVKDLARFARGLA